MRLIELRLKNLNSLKGEWHIDFSDTAFVNEGIFAITGQTGAGKTTILDAICLALYGATPRLGEITSTNDVMTRLTGECYAEVVIELNGKQYRCRWGQRRAYGKSDGNLQSATHEIAEVNIDNPSAGDKVLEEKSSLTKKKIIELTSMDFSQFTRSILLAQGSFSAFLKAKADERADILEKITGTEIYADISKNVHEKFRIEKEELERMQAVANSLSLLDADTEAEYRETIDTLSGELDTKKATQAGFEAQIKWLDAVADLQGKQKQYQQDVQGAEQAKLGFIADAERLDKANKALEISNDFNQLVIYRQHLDSLKTDQLQCKHDLREAEAQLSQNKVDLDHAVSAEQTASNQYEKAQPLIGEIRGLNGQISQTQQRLDDQQTRYDSLTTNIDGLNASLKTSNIEQAQLQTKLDKATDYLSTRSHHESLSRDIESFHQLGLQVKNLLTNTKDKALHRQQAVNNLAQLSQKLESLKSSQQQADAQIESKKQEVDSLKAQHRNLLQGQTLQSLRHQQNHIDQSSKQLNDMRAQFGQIGEVTAQVQALMALLPNNQAKINKCQHRIETNEQTLARLNTEHEDKKTNLELLQQVAKLEDFIHLLQDNEPCPLCGSLEHPYASNHPLLENTSQDALKPSPIVELKNRLGELSIEIKDVEKLIAEDKINLATSKNELNGYQKQLSEQLAQVSKLVTDNALQIASFEQSLEKVSPTLLANFDKFSLISKLNDSQKGLESFFNRLDFDKPANNVSNEDLDKVKAVIDDLLTLLQSVIQDLASQKDALNTVLDDNDRLMHDINQSETALKALQDNAHSALQAINDIETEIKLSQQQVASDDRYIESNTAEIKRLVQSIGELASSYKSDDNDKWITLDNELNQLNNSISDKQALTKLDPETDIEPLREYCRGIRLLQKDYEQQRELSQSLNSEISNLVTKIKGLESQLEQLQGERDALTGSINDLQTNLKSHQDNRQTLYQKMQNELDIQIADSNNSKADDHTYLRADIDAIEKRLRLAMDTARLTLSKVRESYNNNQQRIEQLKQQGLKLDKVITETSENLTQQQAVFDKLLKDNNFADEIQFKEAMLERETREALARQQQQIDSDLKIAQHKLQDTKQQLAEKLAHPLVEDDATDKKTLTIKLSAIEVEISELNKQIGALEQKLKDNEANKANQQAQLEAIKEQQQSFAVWRNLRELIGSADGKKYRTFAQGLTFQIMVSNANTQLKKMSDRYLLTRDEENPLELNVIDDYQGGEIRSTKNLSGGEGFIISLALALGLSKMASQNISVDSLFLDEGFGTLDEDSLDIALNTLTNLQAEGKLIGVISHVQSLKERILTQIKVEKISGGHSQISGTGCYKIAN
ncbi:AAA family ATPase [Psychrobacter lutiphocae]|uniref:AAA family ATPase n=1 Tax=Psychrobacter lutiphocae TaxID=540500 RepID=UPI00037A0DD1|nr:SbcC/MukB-like Walker B domain-containing protein [Psychrobacter lutiphocae]